MNPRYYFVGLCVSVVSAVGCFSHRRVADRPQSTTAAAFAAPTSRPAVVSGVRPTLEYLASDELEGRGVGTHGLDLAADFIAGKLKQAGLRPISRDGDYFQYFTMRGDATIEMGTTLRIGEQTLELNKDYRPLSLSANDLFAGPVAFAGYAVTSKEPAYNDFDGLNTKGKVLIAMRYEPHDENGKSRLSKDGWSDASSINSKVEAAEKAGAAALLLVNPPKFHDADRLMPFDRRYGRTQSKIPVLQITQDVANRLLSAGGVKDLQTLQDLMDAEFQPASAELADGVVVSGNVDVMQRQIPVRNVMAALPGRGPTADEWIVVGAHYDHLGYGGRGSLDRRPTTTQASVPLPGDAMHSPERIHNGADDNASGVSAVLEVARQLVEFRQPLRRSVLFVFFTGEETGLIGSEYFVNNPPISLSKVITMINLDMVGRLQGSTIEAGGRETADSFPKLFDQLDAKSPLQFTGMNGPAFGSSDHASFMVKKIPVIFYFTGLHADYHRPTDDANKINYRGIDEIVALTEDTIAELSTLSKPGYRDVPMSHGSTTQPRASQVQLGIVPSYTEESEGPDGVKINGTSAGTAAEAAGLAAGDLITGIDDKEFRTLYDLMDYLGDAKVGQKITIHVNRGGKMMDLPTTLKARAAD